MEIGLVCVWQKPQLPTDKLINAMLHTTLAI